MRGYRVVLVLLASCGLVVAGTDPAPVPAGTVLQARTFQSAEPIIFQTTMGERAVQRGLMLLVQVDRAQRLPINGPERAFLYGDTLVRAVNRGYKSGVVVLLVPDLDPRTTPLWFGPAQTVGSISPAQLKAQLAALQGRGTADRLAPVEMLERFAVRDLDELYRKGAEWVLQYAPEETETARIYLDVRH